MCDMVVTDVNADGPNPRLFSELLLNFPGGKK